MYSYSNHTFSYDYVQLCSLEHDLKLLPAVITDWHVLEQVLTGGRIAEPDNLAMVGGREEFLSSPCTHVRFAQLHTYTFLMAVLMSKLSASQRLWLPMKLTCDDNIMGGLPISL